MQKYTYMLLYFICCGYSVGSQWISVTTCDISPGNFSSSGAKLGLPQYQWCVLRYIDEIGRCCKMHFKIKLCTHHYDDVTMGAIASRITSLTIVYSTVYSGADQSKHQSSASLAFVWGMHRGPVNSPHKWPVTRKMFPFDDVIMPYHAQVTHYGGYELCGNGSLRFHMW